MESTSVQRALKNNNTTPREKRDVEKKKAQCGTIAFSGSFVEQCDRLCAGSVYGRNSSKRSEILCTVFLSYASSTLGPRPGATIISCISHITHRKILEEEAQHSCAIFVSGPTLLPTSMILPKSGSACCTLESPNIFGTFSCVDGIAKNRLILALSSGSDLTGVTKNSQLCSSSTCVGTWVSPSDRTHEKQSVFVFRLPALYSIVSPLNCSKCSFHRANLSLPRKFHKNLGLLWSV